ncbi:MAG: hypothetical protein KGZ25_15020 [Planctomycetes bacterium]|nr:hypothetical protein [Planctomycetota bacterium]
MYKKPVKGIALAVAAVLLLAISVPAMAQMSKKEIHELWEKKKKHWSRSDMKKALDMAKGRRGLVEEYFRLKKKKVPDRLIADSFAVCRGEPSMVKEFWEWKFKYHFDLGEIKEVFEEFPKTNKITRWYYFAYRVGGTKGETKLPQRQKNPKIQKYSAKECLAIFKLARFDMKLIKEYFTRRDKGKSPREILPDIKQAVKKQIIKERKADEKKRKERLAKLKEKEEAERKLREEERKRRAAERAEKPKEERAKMGTEEDLSFLAGTGDDDGTEPDNTEDDKEESEGDKDEKDKDAEDEKEDGDSEEE